MASKKISQLPGAAALVGGELLAGVQSSGDVVVTPAQIAAYIGLAGAGAVSPSIAAAQATHFASSVGTLTTQGYYAAGDGGGATYKRTSPNAYPGHAYSVQTADGTWWVYIPEPMGWNAKVAGVKADGVADDSVALQNALLPFNSGTFGPAGGLAISGRLILPQGDMIISQPIWYVGQNTSSIYILGQSASGQGTPSRLQWAGSAGNSWPTMFYIVGASHSAIEGVNFQATDSVGLNTCVALITCQLSARTLTAPVSPGVQTVTPNSMSFIAIGTYLTIGKGTSNFEVVAVTATTGSTFTANFRNSHASNEAIGGTPGSSATIFERCTFFPGTASGSFNGTVPSGVFPVGLYCGNNTPGSTPQISEVAVKNCYFASILGAQGGAGVFVQGQGNTCNYRFEYNGFSQLQYSIIYLGGPTCSMLGNASAGITVAEVYGSYCEMHSWESESPGAYLLQGTSGYATIINCRANVTALPASGYGISFTTANLTLIGNSLGQPGIGVYKIQAGGGATLTSGQNAYQVTSIGNYYSNAGTSIPVFYDGSNNALYWGNDFASARKTRVMSIGDYGDTGQLFNMTGQISMTQGGVSMANLVAGGTVDQVNEIGTTTSCVTVPFTAFQTAGLTKQVNMFNILPKTQIVSVIADVTAAFGGTAGTLSLTMESTATSTGGLLTAFDCKTAPVQKGLAATDLGADLTTAASLPPGGFFPSWTTETFVRSTLTSGTGNLSGLNVGSVNFYITVRRLNPS